jgi:uracil-DNA glycosylase family 4
MSSSPAKQAVTGDAEPPPDCQACPRLAAFRDRNRTLFPDFFNAPVPAFGPVDASLIIVGLAPGLKGANRTGRPFTGDYAGDLLYDTLLQQGRACGQYAKHPDDGLTLLGTRIVNAVRCVPPENKPTGPEINTCVGFLRAEFAGLTNAKAVLALGGIAFVAALQAQGLRKSYAKFGHGIKVALPSGLQLIGSYHCSRYNTNTGRLTNEMFETVMRQAVAAANA